MLRRIHSTILAAALLGAVSSAASAQDVRIDVSAGALVFSFAEEGEFLGDFLDLAATILQTEIDRDAATAGLLVPLKGEHRVHEQHMLAFVESTLGRLGLELAESRAGLVVVVPEPVPQPALPAVLGSVELLPYHAGGRSLAGSGDVLPYLATMARESGIGPRALRIRAVADADRYELQNGSDAGALPAEAVARFLMFVEHEAVDLPATSIQLHDEGDAASPDGWDVRLELTPVDDPASSGSALAAWSQLARLLAADPEVSAHTRIDHLEITVEGRRARLGLGGHVDDPRDGNALLDALSALPGHERISSPELRYTQGGGWAFEGLRIAFDPGAAPATAASAEGGADEPTHRQPQR